ncbi:hypothetical protein G9A89_004169 [Geosiphon pyriformis]|nr:hypothetical protein G9A89_004169 [Geosiphon pyriformis]
MENKEITRTHSEIHDCNLCSLCQESILNNNSNRCSACWFIFLKKLYHDFSSGNKDVDEIIKSPIYIPPNRSNSYKANFLYYEWISWERLSNIKEIDRGGFSRIYTATIIDGLINEYTLKHYGSMEYKRWRLEGDVAIKIMSKNSEEVFKELNIQRVIEINNSGYLSDYISSIYGITQNAETLEYGIVMEFAKHGDMRKYLSTNFHLKGWLEKLEIAQRIAEGLISIHSSGIVHRDLHSGNILKYESSYDIYESIQIRDIWLCQPVNHEATATTAITATKTTTIKTGKVKKEKKIYGVVPYIPPEVLRGEKFTMAGDIYSFAMLLWELATGKPPFHDCSHDAILIMAILNGQRPKITSPLIPPCITEIIVKCWDVNPENRPTAKEIRAKLRELLKFYMRFKSKFRYQGIIDKEYKQYLESEKYVKEMAEGDDSTTKTTTTTTTKMSIHPGAVYTSRILTLQKIDFSKG